MDKITGKAIDIVTFLMGDNVDKNTLFDLSPHVEKRGRSLDANAYFHKLCTLLAQAQTPPISMIRAKNMMIADYGQPEYIDDEPVIIKSNLPPDKMGDMEYIHTSCFRIKDENDKKVYFYRVYRGTHTYNSVEFAKLLEGTIQECKNVGIETLPPVEIERMKKDLEAHEKHHSR